MRPTNRLAVLCGSLSKSFGVCMAPAYHTVATLSSLQGCVYILNSPYTDEVTPEFLRVDSVQRINGPKSFFPFEIPLLGLYDTLSRSGDHEIHRLGWMACGRVWLTGVHQRSTTSVTYTHKSPRLPRGVPRRLISFGLPSLCPLQYETYFAFSTFVSPWYARLAPWYSKYRGVGSISRLRLKIAIGVELHVAGRSPDQQSSATIDD